MNFSAYADENGDYYQGNSLPQLNNQTGVINVEKDSLSGVQAVCLTKVGNVEMFLYIIKNSTCQYSHKLL